MKPLELPTSQSELLRAARGEMSQSAFAKLTGVNRSCLSRYEAEKLGVPTALLNHCLQLLAERQSQAQGKPASPAGRALAYLRQATVELETMTPTQRR